MAYSFGSDEFFMRLRDAHTAGDRERLAELAYAGLGPVVATELRKSAFAMFTPEDRQDAKQEVMLYALGRLGAFLDDPRNDPDSTDPERFTPVKRQAWAHRIAYHALLHVRDRIKKHALSPGGPGGESVRVDSLDRELGDGDGGRVVDFIPADHAAPDERTLLRERLEEACQAFFSLKNAPELLAAVGFVILSESLTGAHRSLEAYADLLNGMPAARVVAAMERLLSEYGIDRAVLDGLKRRLDGDDARTIDGLTAKTLANRKNSMLSTLRAGRAREEGD